MQNSEMKSNVNIASNVYIRTENAEYEDVAFIEQITGYNALQKISSKAQNASVSLNLTYAQEQELKNTVPCTKYNNKLGEQTFGAVKIDNEIVWSCRCENIECGNYENCMSLPYSKRIDRDYINLENFYDNIAKEEQLNETLFQEQQDINLNISSQNAETFHFEDTAFNYVKTSDISQIVQAPINECTIVNVKNGTDLISKRLDYVVENDLVTNLSEILVICYNKVSQNNLQSIIPEGVSLVTLDSYATQCLKELDDDKFLSLSYDERIVRFNSKITKIDLSRYKLILVDELHFFQNQRAMMLLNLLKKANSGVFLIGDKCQALFQDNISNTQIGIDTTRLYNLLNKILPRGTKKYEFIVNDENESELTKIYKNIREGLLYKNLVEAKKIILREFKNLETEDTVLEKVRPTLKSNETLVFLCKSDSDAEYVSSILYKNKIQHNLLQKQSSKYSYNRWIADVLWDHCGDFILKDDFVQRYKARIIEDETIALKMFDLLLDFTTDYSFDVTDTDKVSKASLLTNFINAKDVPLNFTNDNQQITVSTVVNSKCEKFDHVYLVDFEIDNLNNDLVKLDKLHEIYVALIIAKKSVKLINFKNNLVFKNTPKQHSYRTYKKYNEEYCTHFSIDDDVAAESFFTGNFREILTSQRHISEIVRVNDKVELILKSNSYHIYHIKNTRTSQKITQYLGVISDEAFNDFKETMFQYNNGILPKRLYDLYISDVVTIPQNSNIDNIPVQFKNSKFVLGVEISGFAKIDWDY